MPRYPVLNPHTHLWLLPYPTMPAKSSLTTQLTFILPSLFFAHYARTMATASQSSFPVNLSCSFLPKSQLSHHPSSARPPALIIKASFTVYQINSKRLGLAFRSWAATYLFSFILYLLPKQYRHGCGQAKQALFTLIPSRLSWYSLTTQTPSSTPSSYLMSTLQPKVVTPLHFYFIYSPSFIQLSTSSEWDVWC